jgi:hypothetical protein
LNIGGLARLGGGGGAGEVWLRAHCDGTWWLDHRARVLAFVRRPFFVVRPDGGDGSGCTSVYP